MKACKKVNGCEASVEIDGIATKLMMMAGMKAKVV